MFPLRGFFRKRRGGVLSLPSCTVVMVGLWAAACSSHASPHPEKPRLPVTTPLRKDTVLYDRYVCQIRAARHIEVRALERGYLQAIYVDEGQFVRAGQPLFQILPAIYQAEYQKAQAELHYAEVEYQNARILADSGVISPSQLALVRAKLEKAQAELALAQTHLQFTFIRAPFDGIVGMLQVRIGSLLEEGELLTTLTDNSELWVYFNLPERDYLDYMRRVRPDSTVKVKLELANGQIFPHEGVITAIEAEFDNTTGNVPVRATFPNPQRLLRHGETGNILIPFAIRNLLNEERCFGGGQPCGLAAASARGRRPPSAGSGLTKYHQLAFKNSLHRIGIMRFCRRRRALRWNILSL
jgi:membrane fusion protein (multidrug efflux system)